MSSYDIKKLHDKLDKCELHIQRIKEIISGCEKTEFEKATKQNNR